MQAVENIDWGKAQESKSPFFSNLVLSIDVNHRRIVALAGFILLLPIVFLSFRVPSVGLPLSGLMLALLIAGLWGLSHWELALLRRGTPQKFFGFYRLMYLFHQDVELHRLVTRLCEELARWLECKRVYCFALNEQGAHYEPLGWFDQAKPPPRVKIPAQDRLVGYLLTRRAPLYLSQEQSDARLNHLFSQADGWWLDLGLVMLVPIFRFGKLLGFLGLGEKINHEPYYTLELRNLQVLSLNLAILLDETRAKDRLRRQTQELASMQETLSRLISNPFHLDALLENVVESLKLVFPQTRAVELCLWDEARKRAVVRKVSGDVPITPGYEYPEDAGLRGRIIRERRPVLIKDVLAQKDSLGLDSASYEHFRSFVGVPLISRDKLIGTLELDSKQPYAFDEEDLKFLETLAPRIASLIDNLQTQQRSQNKRETIIEAYNIMSRFISSGMESRRIISFLAATAAEVIGADACTIRIWEDDKLVLNQCIGPDALWNPPSWEVELCKGGGTIRIEDLYEINPASRVGQMRSFMAVPLMRADEPIGWIGVWKKEPHRFSDAEEEHLRSFAAQVMAMWNRLILIRELELRSRELFTFHKLCAALERVQGLRELAEKSLSLVLALFSQAEKVEGCMAFFASDSNWEGAEVEPVLHKSEAFPSLLSDFINTVSPLRPIESSQREELLRLIRQAGFLNTILIPIEFGGRIWGLMCFTSPQSDYIQARYGEFLKVVSAQVGVSAARIIASTSLREVEGGFIEALFEASDGAYMVDRRGYITCFSPKAQALTGFAPG